MISEVCPSKSVLGGQSCHRAALAFPGMPTDLVARDRVWFKVKTGNDRAAITKLRGDELANEIPTGVGEWWIGAAGYRQDQTSRLRGSRWRSNGSCSRKSLPPRLAEIGIS